MSIPSGLSYPTTACFPELPDHELLASIAQSSQAIANGGGGGTSLGGIFTPEQFKQSSDPDDTASVQAAINAAANVQGIVWLSPKTYSITSGLTSTKACSILGCGIASVIEITDAGTADIIYFAPTSDPTTADAGLQGMRMENFSIQSTVARTAGYALHLKFTHNAYVHGIWVDSIDATQITGGVKMWGGISMEAQSAMMVEHCQICTKWYGIYTSGDRTLTSSEIPVYGYNGTINECDCWGAQGADHHSDIVQNSCGCYIDGGGGGVKVSGGSKCNFSHYDFGIWVAETNQQEVFLSAFCDGNADTGTYIDGGTKVHLENHWGEASGDLGVGWSILGDGVYISSNFSGEFIANGGAFGNNSGFSLQIAGAGQILVNGCRAGALNITGNCAAIFNGIQSDQGVILTASAGTLTFTGCDFSSTSPATLTFSAGVTSVYIMACKIQAFDPDTPSAGLHIDSSITDVLISGVTNEPDYSTATTTPFSGLPASPVQGMKWIVTDSTTAVFNATVSSGGGGNVVNVFYNGTNWVVS